MSLSGPAHVRLTRFNVMPTSAPHRALQMPSRLGGRAPHHPNDCALASDFSDVAKGGVPRFVQPDASSTHMPLSWPWGCFVTALITLIRS